MSTDPLAPSEVPPPRTVQPWTTVPGHNVSRSRSFCECGAQAPRDFTGERSEWREQHLAEAWPILVPRLPGESPGDWTARVSDELVVASHREQELFARDGHNHGLAPGEPIPVISTELSDASNRVAVLEHQLAEVSERSRRRFGAEDL